MEAPSETVPDQQALSVHTDQVPLNGYQGKSYAKEARMYYELRIYTPQKGKLDDYAALFHAYPEKAFERLGAGMVGAWAVDGSEQPAFVYILSFRDKAHRDEVFAKLREQPEMKEYLPKRPQLIDTNIPSMNWLLKPVAFSKIK
ncbi:MAG: NIPSNAP family protein [Chloroflexi bacterium]|nr:NIPSNAP family protein [Chloroflexota bacterium]